MNENGAKSAHIHADVSENTYVIQGRSECFNGPTAFERARSWLGAQIEMDEREYPNPEIGDWHTLVTKCRAWVNTGKTWEGTIAIPGDREGFGFLRGYRIMWMTSPCERQQ